MPTYRNNMMSRATRGRVPSATVPKVPAIGKPAVTGLAKAATKIPAKARATAGGAKIMGGNVVNHRGKSFRFRG